MDCPITGRRLPGPDVDGVTHPRVRRHRDRGCRVTWSRRGRDRHRRHRPGRDAMSPGTSERAVPPAQRLELAQRPHGAADRVRPRLRRAPAPRGRRRPVRRFWAFSASWSPLGVTDGVDGKLARSRGQITNFGKVADPIADKWRRRGWPHRPLDARRSGGGSTWSSSCASSESPCCASSSSGTASCRPSGRAQDDAPHRSRSPRYLPRRGSCPSPRSEVGRPRDPRRSPRRHRRQRYRLRLQGGAAPGHERAHVSSPGRASGRPSGLT